MSNNPSLLIALSTYPSSGAAEAVAQAVIEKRLGACVQILPGVTSFYPWAGKLEKETEVLLLIKTLDSQKEELSDFLKARHPYQVPEIIFLKADSVHEAYLEWLCNWVRPSQ